MGQLCAVGDKEALLVTVRSQITYAGIELIKATTCDFQYTPLFSNLVIVATNLSILVYSNHVLSVI